MDFKKPSMQMIVEKVDTLSESGAMPAENEDQLNNDIHRLEEELYAL
jgi:hypothetical protein